MVHAIQKAREALSEAIDYFDGRADAEYFTDSPSPVPNEEMKRLVECQEALAALEAERGENELLRGRGAVALDDLYRAARAHPKTLGRRHWREKLRQVLQQGPFERLDRGVWRLQGDGP